MWMWAGLIAFGTVVASLYTATDGLDRRSASRSLVTVGLTFLVPLLPAAGGHADGGGARAGPDPDSKAPQTL